MSDDSIADVINLLAAPLAGGIRTVEQARRGVDELFTAVENLNRTMANLNETAERINALLGDVEEPIRAMVPQLTRTIRAADEITAALEEPVRSAAPNIERVVGTLSSPAFTALPQQVSEFMSSVGDLSQRLGPLAQLAEGAGGMFGGFRMPGMSRSGGGSSSDPTAVRTQPTDDDGAPERQPPSVKRAPTSGSSPKKAGPKKAGARKASARKTSAKTAGAKKTSAKKAAARQRIDRSK